MSDDQIDMVSKALRRAWQLGKIYWQQADSEYISQHRKVDETQRKFEALVDETRAALATTAPAVEKEANASRYCQSCGNYVAVGMDADHEDWCSELGWKKRALEAEELNRKFMESVNGPTHMGEPVIAAHPAVECSACVDGICSAHRAVEKGASIPPIFYNGETKRDPVLRARLDAHIAMATRTASGPELQAALSASPTMGDSAGEPVATLHDDGYWTWKKGAPPHESNYAGWRMDVYAHPPAQTADVRAMTDEQKHAIEQGVGLLWALGKRDEAKTLRALLEQKP